MRAGASGLVAFVTLAVGLAIAAAASSSSSKAPVRRVPGRGKPLGRVKRILPATLPELPPAWRPLRASEMNDELEAKIEKVLEGDHKPGDLVPWWLDGLDYLGLVETIELPDGTRERSIAVYVAAPDPLKVPVIPLPDPRDPRQPTDDPRDPRDPSELAEPGETWRYHARSNLDPNLCAMLESGLRARLRKNGSELVDFNCEAEGKGSKISAAVLYSKKTPLETGRSDVAPGVWVEVLDAERVE